MKIAICLSGKPDFTEESIKHIHQCVIDDFNSFDFYIHTWQEKDFPFKGIKKIKTENYPSFSSPTSRFDQCVPPFNTFSQLYSISQSIELALNSGVEYDLYIRCRFDVYIGNKINYDKLSKGFVYMLPEGRNENPRWSREYPNKIGILPLPKDFFWICDKKGALISSTLFKNIVQYNLNENIILCPEDLIFHHFAVNNLQIKLLENNIINGLFRQKHHHGNGLIIYDRYGPKKA